MNDAPYYITTSISYPNGNPHMGHALEWVQADFLARYYRQFTKRPVRFQTGIDEHGLKVQRTAEKAGVGVQEFVEEKHAVFLKVAKELQISYDRFIRTGEAEHKAMAQALWKACAAAGDIYKKTYRAWYNVKQEEFLGLADEVADPSVFGVDPQFVELIEEENYFFAASRYTDRVLDLLKTEGYKVIPKNRLHELVNFVESKGLQDVSVSRDRQKLSWGVPVPGDENQVMYVWFDALTNYLTGAATLENDEIVTDNFWPASLHIVGKDISRFHALLWPAMLMSAGLPTPQELLVHGFVLSEGKAMSKSLGNVVDPQDMVQEFGANAVRWFLLKEIPTTGDGDFTRDRLAEIYSSDLANDYGNLVSRVLTMCHKYVDGRVPDVSLEQVENLEQAVVNEQWQAYHEAVREKQIQAAVGAAHNLVVFCNRRIEELKPWVLAKEEKKDELQEFLYELLEIIRTVTIMLQPVIPMATEKVWAAVFQGQASQQEGWGGLQTGLALGAAPVILFPRLETA